MYVEKNERTHGLYFWWGEGWVRSNPQAPVFFYQDILLMKMLTEVLKDWTDLQPFARKFWIGND